MNEFRAEGVFQVNKQLPLCKVSFHCFASFALGGKKERAAYPELNELAQLVLLEVAFLAILIVFPSREHPVTKCSLKYLSDPVSEAVCF